MDKNNKISRKLCEKLNLHKNRLKIQGEINRKGKVISPYKFSVGVGEKHCKEIVMELFNITRDYEWLKSEDIYDIFSNIVIVIQDSILRNIVERVNSSKKIAGYFMLTVSFNNDFFSCTIEEFAEYFDFYDKVDNMIDPEKSADCYTLVDQIQVDSIGNLTDKESLYMLTSDNNIIEVDKNFILYDVISDNEFHLSSFYKDNNLLWKRTYFCVNNHVPAKTR